jgi:hypothetical protein
MKTLIALAVVAGVLAAPAVAAAPNPAMVKLQKQVKVLQRQVSTLTFRLARDEQQLKDRDTCFFAVEKDTDRGFFHTLGLIVQQITGNPPPPDLPRFDDAGACLRVGIPRP